MATNSLFIFNEFILPQTASLATMLNGSTPVIRDQNPGGSFKNAASDLDHRELSNII
jgi:hypothetical protein